MAIPQVVGGRVVLDPTTPPAHELLGDAELVHQQRHHHDVRPHFRAPVLGVGTQIDNRLRHMLLDYFHQYSSDRDRRHGVRACSVGHEPQGGGELEHVPIHERAPVGNVVGVDGGSEVLVGRPVIQKRHPLVPDTAYPPSARMPQPAR